MFILSASFEPVEQNVPYTRPQFCIFGNFEIAAASSTHFQPFPAWCLLTCHLNNHSGIKCNVIDVLYDFWPIYCVSMVSPSECSVSIICNKHFVLRQEIQKCSNLYNVYLIFF